MISRRGFLKLLGVAPAVPAVAALPAVAPTAPAVQQVKAQAAMRVVQVAYEMDDCFSHCTVVCLAGNGTEINSLPTRGIWLDKYYVPPV